MGSNGDNHIVTATRPHRSWRRNVDRIIQHRLLEWIGIQYWRNDRFDGLFTDEFRTIHRPLPTNHAGSTGQAQSKLDRMWPRRE